MRSYSNTKEQTYTLPNSAHHGDEDAQHLVAEPSDHSSAITAHAW